MALVVNDGPKAPPRLFTRNRARPRPVTRDRRRRAITAVLLNSGNANACNAGPA